MGSEGGVADELELLQNIYVDELQVNSLVRYIPFNSQAVSGMLISVQFVQQLLLQSCKHHHLNTPGSDVLDI